MLASLGRIVHIIGMQADANGTDVAPAIITRVWSEDMVNVTVFPDNADARRATSVRIYADEQEARAASTAYEHRQTAAFWPPRV